MNVADRWSRYIVTVLAAGFLLAACGAPPTGTGSSGLDLKGLWLVTPGPTTYYGAGGTTTVEFGAATSGSATFLSQADANDITTCERHVYAVVGDDVVLLDGTYYLGDAVSADRIVLDNGTDALTLDRVTGAAPVAPCAEAIATELGTFAFSVGGFSNLNAFQTRLYFNTDDTSDPIVGYDTATGTVGAARIYSQSVSGGTHRWVVGARSDDLFYGHCGCGGSTSVDRFDLALDTSLAVAETDTDLGVNLGVRYGYFGGGDIVIGGRDRDDSGVNRLLTLNADTLALASQRQFLPDAAVQDVALRNGELLALVNDGLVVVGADGRAEQTIKLTGDPTSSPRGVAAIGNTVYVLGENASGDAVLLEIALP